MCCQEKLSLYFIDTFGSSVFISPRLIFNQLISTTCGSILVYCLFQLSLIPLVYNVAVSSTDHDNLCFYSLYWISCTIWNIYTQYIKVDIFMFGISKLQLQKQKYMLSLCRILSSFTCCLQGCPFFHVTKNIQTYFWVYLQFFSVESKENIESTLFSKKKISFVVTWLTC